MLGAKIPKDLQGELAAVGHPGPQIHLCQGFLIGPAKLPAVRL